MSLPKLKVNMKCIVLGGFLGSGKTTVLLDLAKGLKERSKLNIKTPVVIIENEIGEISVDGKLLGDFEIREIFAGCVCCTLSADLTMNVKSLYSQYQPEWIIIESTGLAYPDKIVDAINKYAQECESVVTVNLADASRWFEIKDYMDVFLLGQMKTGDIMIVNKIDLVSEDIVSEISGELAELNSCAQILKLSARDGIDHLVDLILEVINDRS